MTLRIDPGTAFGTGSHESTQLAIRGLRRYLTEGMKAGLTAYAAPLNHYDVVAEKRNGQMFIKSNVQLGQTCHSEKEFKLNGTHAWLRIASDKDFY